MAIDEVPFEWFTQRGVKLDLREYEDDYVMMPADLEREFPRTDHELSRSISCSLTSQRGRGMAKTSLTAAPLKQSHSSDVGAGLELGAEPGDSGQVLHCH